MKKHRNRRAHKRFLLDGAASTPTLSDDVASATRLIGEIQTAFAEFRSKNDEQLEEIRNGMTDVVRTEEIDRINATMTERQSELDELNRRIAASSVDGASSEYGSEDREHTNQITNYMRRGAEPTMTATAGQDPDGGYTVSHEMEDGIDRIVGSFGAMRSLARVQSISDNEYRRLRGLGGSTSGWVGEEDSRPETSTPTLQMLRFPTHELYANPAATQTLLEDGQVDIAAWLAEEVGIEFAEEESEAFITGNGNNRPRGIIGGYTPVANSSFGNSSQGFGYIATGVSGAFGAGGTTSTGQSDEILDMIYALNRAYRQNGTFIMNDLTQAEVRKFKDADGHYIWQPSLQAGEPSQLLGYAVEVDDFMPDVGADSFSIAFGDWARAYLIIDRRGVAVLRDPFTNKPYVHFYTTKRVGGGIQNFEAAKLLKFGTS